jgi:tRNA pseudouridine55 synthase
MTSAARSGVLVVDKAPGVTSFDVVARVRRALGVRRVGHAGTLDPDATGVLPILIGEATKLMPYLADQDKEYAATLRLGVTTDTHDLGGRVVATAPVPPLTAADIEAAAHRFIGAIKQVPPMYSAVHHEGRRLYELARAGVEVEREPREVVVHAIGVEEVAGDRVRLRVVCGKGTYVRVLAADLGAVLGCGAAVERLVRLRVGPFSLSGAMPSVEITREAAETLWRQVQSPEAALAGWGEVRLLPAGVTAFLNGQAAEAGHGDAATPRLVRVHDGHGRFLGVGELQPGGRRVRPVRILHADRPGPSVLPA